MWPRAWLTWTDGRATVGRQARAAGGERRPAAGRNRGLGRRWAGENRDVTPGAWLTRTDGRTGGRVQTILLQSCVTACLVKKLSSGLTQTHTHTQTSAYIFSQIIFRSFNHGEITDAAMR